MIPILFVDNRSRPHKGMNGTLFLLFVTLSVVVIIGLVALPVIEETQATSRDTRLPSVSERNFYDIVSGNERVLVEFWAEWCGPCTQFMMPIFDEVAMEYGGLLPPFGSKEIKFARVNIDNNDEIAERFDVHELPAYIMFVNGKVVDSEKSAIGKQGLERMINRNQ